MYKQTIITILFALVAVAGHVLAIINKNLPFMLYKRM